MHYLAKEFVKDQHSLLYHVVQQLVSEDVLILNQRLHFLRLRVGFQLGDELEKEFLKALFCHKHEHVLLLCIFEFSQELEVSGQDQRDQVLIYEDGLHFQREESREAFLEVLLEFLRRDTVAYPVLVISQDNTFIKPTPYTLVEEPFFEGILDLCRDILHLFHQKAYVFLHEGLHCLFCVELYQKDYEELKVVLEGNDLLEGGENEGDVFAEELEESEKHLIASSLQRKYLEAAVSFLVSLFEVNVCLLQQKGKTVEILESDGHQKWSFTVLVLQIELNLFLSQNSETLEGLCLATYCDCVIFILIDGLQIRTEHEHSFKNMRELADCYFPLDFPLISSFSSPTGQVKDCPLLLITPLQIDLGESQQILYYVLISQVDRNSQRRREMFAGNVDVCPTLH